MDISGLAGALVNGWISGAMGIAATHPMDTVRIKMQAMRHGKKVVIPSSIQIFRDTLRKGGLRNLFFGIIPPVFVRGISFSMQRGVMHVGNKLLNAGCTATTRRWLHRTSLDKGICGSVAGTISIITDCPTYLMKCRAQTVRKPGEHSETLRAYYRAGMDLYRSHGRGLSGIRSLYLGVPPLIVSKFFSWGLLYYVYDVMRQQGYGPLVAGPVAALASWPPLYPLDVLRTRIQTADPKLNLTYRDHYRQFWQAGSKQWFAGLEMTMIRTVPRFAITFLVLESMESMW